MHENLERLLEPPGPVNMKFISLNSIFQSLVPVMKESCPQKLDYRIVGKIFLLFLFRERDVGNHKYYLYPTNHILVFKENSDSSKLNGSDPKDKIRHRAPHFHTYLLKRTHKQHSDVEHGVFWNCEFCAFGVP